MFKRLKWMVIIPGVLGGVAQAQPNASINSAEYVEKDIFEFHTPPQDLSQKDFQSADYKVTYLTPAPTKEEKDLLIESGKILSNRDWFLRRIEKNEEPAKSWLRAQGYIDKGKDAPSAEQLKKAVDAQKVRLKKAVADYNTLVANVLEKRKTPTAESVIEEDKDHCKQEHQTAAPSTSEVAASVGSFPLTIAPAPIAHLSQDYFKIAHTQINEDTKVESTKQVEAAKHDFSYITPSLSLSASISGTAVDSSGQGNSANIKGASLQLTKEFLSQHAVLLDQEVGNEYPRQSAASPIGGTQLAEKINVPSTEPLMSLVTDPNDHNIAYAISSDSPQRQEGNFIVMRTEEHIMKTIDGGKTWSEQGKITAERADNESFGNFRKITLSPDGHELYVTSDAGISVSQDGGKTFNLIPDSPKEALDVKASKDGRLAVSYGNAGGVVIFENSSGVWKKATSQPADLVSWANEKAKTEPRCSETGNDCPYGGGEKAAIYSVQFDPNDADTVYAGMGRGLYRYRPSTGWQLMKNIYGDSTVYNIDISSTGKIRVATCNGVYEAQTSTSNTPLVFSKDRSTAFINQSDGKVTPNYLRANDVVADPENPKKIVATSASGVYVSENSGASWNRINGGDLPSQDSKGNYAQFDSATWLKNGAVEVSGPSGTFRFTP